MSWAVLVKRNARVFARRPPRRGDGQTGKRQIKKRRERSREKPPTATMANGDTRIFLTITHLNLVKASSSVFVCVKI